VPVTVKHEASGIWHEAKVAFTVLPPLPASDSCRPSIRTLTMGNPLSWLINANETWPPPPKVIAAIYQFAPSEDVYRWDIPLMKDPGLAPSESIVVLQNRTDSAREIATCSAVARTIRVESGQDGQIGLTNGADSGIVFRQPLCTSSFIWCVSTSWRDVMIMEEPGFWRAFGGRTMIFRMQHR